VERSHRGVYDLGARSMSAPTPPTPDGEPWAAEYVSSNGAPPDPVSERTRRLVVLGYITAVALPPIGLILGIVLGTRRAKASSKHWMWIIVLSIIGAILWSLVFASGALTTTNNDLTSQAPSRDLREALAVRRPTSAARFLLLPRARSTSVDVDID